MDDFRPVGQSLLGSNQSGFRPVGQSILNAAPPSGPPAEVAQREMMVRAWSQTAVQFAEAQAKASRITGVGTDELKTFAADIRQRLESLPLEDLAGSMSPRDRMRVEDAGKQISRIMEQLPADVPATASARKELDAIWRRTLTVRKAAEQADRERMLSSIETPTSKAVDQGLDITSQAGAGATAFAGSIYDLGVTALSLGTASSQFNPWSEIAEEMEPQTIAGGLSRGVTQFALGWTTGGVALRGGGMLSQGTGRAAQFGNSMVQGAAADFISFDAHEQRLSNLVEQFPALSNPVSQYLAADASDSEVEGRIKNLLEGAGVGAGIEGFVTGLRALKRGKKLAAEGKPEAAAKVMEQAAKQVEKLSQAAPDGPASEDIARKAYEMWEDSGRPAGRDIEFWTAAENALRGGEPEVAQSTLSKIAPVVYSETDAPGLISALSGRREISNLGQQTFASTKPDLALGQGKNKGILVEYNTGRLQGKIDESKPAAQMVGQQGGGSEVLIEGRPRLRDIRSFTIRDDANLGVIGAEQLRGLTEQLEGQGWSKVKADGGTKWTAPEIAPKAPQVVSVTAKALKGVPLDETQQAALTANMERVAKGEIDLSDAAEGIDFNFSKMDSSKEVKAALNWMSETIGGRIDALKGGVQTHREIVRAAEIIGEKNPERLVAQLRQDAEKAGTLTQRFVAGKMMLQSLARDITDKAAVLYARGLNDDSVRGELGGMMSVWADLQASLKAVQTGSARTTGAGRIMTRDSLGEMSLEQLDTFTRVVVATGGDPAKIGKAMQKGWLGRAVGVHNEYWINMLLSGPKTLIVNGLTTGLKTLYLPAEQIVGGALGADRRAVMEGLRIYKGYVASASDALKLAGRAWMQESPILTGASKVMASHAIQARTFGLKDGTWLGEIANWTGKAVRLPSRTLNSTDEFFKQIAYRAKVRAQLIHEGISLGLDGGALDNHIAEGMSRSFDEAGRGVDEAAVFFARDVTFTRELEGIPKTADDVLGRHPSLRLVVPFLRTAQNVLSDGLQRTPGLNVFMPQLWRDIKSTDPALRAQARGKVASSAAFLAVGAALVNEGKITGRGPSDPDLRREWEAAGFRPYSIIIHNDDGSVSAMGYERLDPFSKPLMLLADWTSVSGQVKDGQRDSLAMGLMQVTADNMFRGNWTDSMSATFDALHEPERYGERWFHKQVGSYVPNALRQTNTDPHYREVRTALDSIMSRIPGLSDNLPPRRNIFGDPILVPPGYGIDSLNPFAFSRTLPDEVTQELSKMQAGFQLPAEAIGTVDLTQFRNANGQDAYDRYLQLHGEVEAGGMTLKGRLKHLIASDSYQNLPDFVAADYQSRRVAEVRRVVAQYRMMALNQLQKEYPEIEVAIRAERRNRLVVPLQGLEAVGQ